MTAKLLAFGLPLLALSACNVERDAGNDTTTLSVDEQKVGQTVDETGNVLKDAAGDVRNAADRAGPVLQNAARDAGNAADRAGEDIARGADRAGDRIENGADRAAGEVREETRDNPPRR